MEEQAVARLDAVHEPAHAVDDVLAHRQAPGVALVVRKNRELVVPVVGCVLASPERLSCEWNDRGARDMEGGCLCEG